MKDKWTDLAAGRLGPSKTHESASDDRSGGRPSERPRRRTTAAGNYGIGRLGIVPGAAKAAAPAAQPGQPEAAAPRGALPGRKPPYERPAPRSADSLLLEPSNDPPSPRAHVDLSAAITFDNPTAAGDSRAAAGAAPDSVFRRAWQAARSRPGWAACACGAAVVCFTAAIMLLKSTGGGTPRAASAEAVQAPSPGPGQVLPAGSSQTASASPGQPGARQPPAPRAPAAPAAASARTAAPQADGKPVPPRAAPSLSRSAEQFLAGVRAELDDWSRGIQPRTRPADPPAPPPAAPAPAPVPAARGESAPPAPARSDANTPPAVRNVGYSNPSGIVVSAILRGRDGPVALINKEFCRPGGTVGGATVVRIGESWVELEQDGQRFQVSVSSAAPPPEPAAADEPDAAPAETPREPTPPARRPQPMSRPAPRR